MQGDINDIIIIIIIETWFFYVAETGPKLMLLLPWPAFMLDKRQVYATNAMFKETSNTFVWLEEK